MFTYQALDLLVFLLPGFVCMALLDMLTPSIKRDNLQKIINALIFSFIIYAFHELIFQNFPVQPAERTPNPDNRNSIIFSNLTIWFLVIFSILIPVIISVSIKFDIHMRVLRYLKITDRTSRTNVWFDVFTDIKSFVIINFEDGRRLYGWPEYYSDYPDDKTIFVTLASWIDDDGKLTELGNRGILITPNEKIDTIEFTGEKGGT